MIIFNTTTSLNLRRGILLLLAVLSVLAICHWFYLGGRRFFYPYEVIWMEGSMLDQVLRVLSGKSLYIAPSIEYVPWLYQPIYYYATAVIAKLIGLSFTSARLISVLSTISTGTTISIVVYKETNKNKLWALIGAGLFFAAYGKVGYCYEVARVDPIFLALLVSGSAVVIYAKKTQIIILGSCLLALSYFTKQSAAIFFPGIATLLFFRNKKNSITFILSISFLLLVGIYVADLFSDGWYSYYTLKIPQAKEGTFQWQFGITGFFEYVVLRCWIVTILLFLLVTISRFRLKTKRFLTSNDAIIFWLFAAALLTGFLGIGNKSGGHNVLIPIAAFSAIVLPITIYHKIAESSTNQTAMVWASLVLLQFLALISNPYHDPRNIPSSYDEVRQETFVDMVRALPGEVWIPYHGFMPHSAGKKTYAELLAFEDILLMHDSTAQRLKHESDSILLAHRFTYIIDDLRDTFPGYSLEAFIPNLNKAHVLDDTMLYVFTPSN